MNELKFVDVGEGITEGHITKWVVPDGADVKEDQTIVQVETDKAVVNVPAPISGIVKIVAKENSIVHVGDTIAMIGTADELKVAVPSKQAAAPAQAQKAQAAPQQMAAAPKSKETIATPSVRKLARDINVNLANIVGTGPEGRIVENDIRAAAGQTSKQAAPPQKFSEVVESKHKDEIVRVPMSMTRKAIARNMEESWKIPRAVHMDLINATELWNTVSKEKPKLLKDLGVKLSFLPLIIKATVEALKECPNFNSSYDHETSEIIQKKYYNIGLAAEAPDGLKVVVIKEADKKSIIEIAKEIQALHEKIENNTITIDEMKDSTFTITNIGSLGGGYLSVPMINPPEVAILGIHAIKDMPVVVDGEIVIGKVLPFSLSFDHRVVDGADAVKFGNWLIKYLEDPAFLEML